jgi:hypothetical protein
MQQVFVLLKYTKYNHWLIAVLASHIRGGRCHTAQTLLPRSLHHIFTSILFYSKQYNQLEKCRQLSKELTSLKLSQRRDSLTHLQAISHIIGVTKLTFRRTLPCPRHQGRNGDELRVADTGLRTAYG